MTIAKPKPIDLETFLGLPETEPPSEFIDGRVFPKPMPKARHSRLQGKLVQVINAIAEPAQIAYAFPELRCTFGSRSIVADIAVLRWAAIHLDQDGELLDEVRVAPDWMIEILSPDQSPNRVVGNILHALQYSCQLGWLIDPADRSVLIFQGFQQPRLVSQNDALTVLEYIPLELTAYDIFSWLDMEKKC